MMMPDIDNHVLKLVSHLEGSDFMTLGFGDIIMDLHVALYDPFLFLNDIFYSGLVR